MKKNKTKWIEDVFLSMQGSQRAKPNPELFAKIESQINNSLAKTSSMISWRYAAAAVIIILFINIFAVSQINRQNLETTSFNQNNPALETRLISNYKLYE